MNDRLAPGLEAMALIRRAEVEGGFGAVLAKGDADRGSVLLAVRQRGAYLQYLERSLAMDGSYRWQRCGPAYDSPESDISQFAGKRRAIDPDLWLIELDVADGERFIAETI